MSVTKMARKITGFSIASVVKFDSLPAWWSVTIRLGTGEALVARVDSETFYNFSKFQSALHEQTLVMLTEISQANWKDMIGNVEPIVKRLPR